MIGTAANVWEAQAQLETLTSEAVASTMGTSPSSTQRKSSKTSLEEETHSQISLTTMMASWGADSDLVTKEVLPEDKTVKRVREGDSNNRQMTSLMTGLEVSVVALVEASEEASVEDSEE